MRMNYIFAGSYNSLLYECVYERQPAPSLAAKLWRAKVRLAARVCGKSLHPDGFKFNILQVNKQGAGFSHAAAFKRGNFHQNSERVKMVCLLAPSNLKALESS
jgi:hypothetical protein